MSYRHSRAEGDDAEEVLAGQGVEHGEHGVLQLPDLLPTHRATHLGQEHDLPDPSQFQELLTYI